MVDMQEYIFSIQHVNNGGFSIMNRVNNQSQNFAHVEIGLATLATGRSASLSATTRSFDSKVLKFNK